MNAPITKLVFIRHAETEWNASGRWQGHTDVPLSDHGRTQANALAQRLAYWQADALYCSDLQRAAETAQQVARAIGLPAIPDSAWREWDVGLCSGLTSQEIRARFPNLPVGTLFDAPEGESASAFYERVGSAMDRLVAAHSGQTVLVVTHGGVIRMMLAHILGETPDARLPIAGRANTSLTIVEANDHGLRLAVMNDSAHLEAVAKPPETSQPLFN